jgi:hypothetical protein
MEITIDKFNRFKNKETMWAEVLFTERDKAPYQNGTLKVAIPHDENMTIKEIEAAVKVEAINLLKAVTAHLDQP